MCKLASARWSNFIYPLPPVSVHFTRGVPSAYHSVSPDQPVWLTCHLGEHFPALPNSLKVTLHYITSVLVSLWSLALSGGQAVPKWQLLPQLLGWTCNSAINSGAEETKPKADAEFIT